MTAPARRLDPDAAPPLVHGESSPLADVLQAIARVAPTDSPVLLIGEAGTGKALLARRVHEQSARAHRAFVRVDCATVPPAGHEAELFGDLRAPSQAGARRGSVALAAGGTLFLDGLGALPLEAQEKLVRLLEGHGPDVRLVAATNADLAAEVEAGRFRRDLLLLLMVCPVLVAPLRSRRGDVLPLFEHFCAERGERRPLEPEARRAFERHAWPGNVDELKQLAERVAASAQGATIRCSDLPWELRQATGEPGSAGLSLVSAHAQASATLPTRDEPREPRPPLPLGPERASASPGTPGAAPPTPARLLSDAVAPTFPIDLPGLLREVEELYLAAALEKSHGNRKAAADLLGLRRTTLVEKLRRKARETVVT